MVDLSGALPDSEHGDLWFFLEPVDLSGSPQVLLEKSWLTSVPTRTSRALRVIAEADPVASAAIARYDRWAVTRWDPHTVGVYVLVYQRAPASGAGPVASVGFDQLRVTVDARQRRILEIVEHPFQGTPRPVG